MAVNFTKNQDEITKAWRNVVELTKAQNWALFGYEGSTNVIRLMSTGSRGLEELVEEFNCSLIQYAFCRVIDEQIGLNKLVLINWQGESAPLSRKGLCASHVGDVANYFKGCAQTITIRNDDEATKEHLMSQIMKTSASKINISRQNQTKISTNETTGNDSEFSVKNSTASGQKTDIASDLAANRKSFWQRQEEEEKERLAEEKRRAAERQAQFERERKQKEESEARKLAETIEQRDRLIDATRQADRKASTHNSASNSSSSSQPSSILSSGPAAEAGHDDDGCVGRRSELIRLERNQETQSLISKGLIKNKRAIFEQQASQAQQQQQQQTTLARRSSGAIITQRLNAFKSLDVSTASDVGASPTTNSVNKLANGFAKKVGISGDEAEVKTPIKKEVQTVRLTNNEDTNLSNVSYKNENETANHSYNEKPVTQHEASPKGNATTNYKIESPSISAQPENHKSPTKVSNGNISSPALKQSQNDGAALIKNESDGDDQPIARGKLSEAIALFDYEAADNTEISFDPDDKIGFIQKVDPGWWQGKVMSGRFKDQIGLFPSNYVKEL